MNADGDATLHRNLAGSILFTTLIGLVFGLVLGRNSFSHTSFFVGQVIEFPIV